MNRFALILITVASLVSCGTSGKQSTANERVISLAPNLTEMMYFIGEGKRLVAVTRFCDYPASVTNLPKVGGLNDISLETVIKLKPDLILASYSGNPRDKVERLISLGFKVVTFREKTADDILSNIHTMAKLFDRDVTALVTMLAQKPKSIQTGTHSPRAMVVLSTSLPLYSVSTNSFVGDLMARAGIDNVVKSAVAYPALRSEDLLTLKPEWVIVPSNMKSDIASLNMLFSTLKLKPKIYYIDANILSRPGPRAFDAIVELGRMDKSTNK